MDSTREERPESCRGRRHRPGPYVPGCVEQDGREGGRLVRRRRDGWLEWLGHARWSSRPGRLGGPRQPPPQGRGGAVSTRDSPGAACKGGSAHARCGSRGCCTGRRPTPWPRCRRAVHPGGAAGAATPVPRTTSVTSTTPPPSADDALLPPSPPPRPLSPLPPLLLPPPPPLLAGAAAHVSLLIT